MRLAALPAFRGQLDHAEGGDAVGADAAQFAVEIGLAGAERRQGSGDLRIFRRPVESGARQQLHRAMIEARVHAVAIVFDFVEPTIAFRRRVDKAGQLRADPSRQRDHGDHRNTIAGLERGPVCVR
jgi:hypothetical protein